MFGSIFAALFAMMPTKAEPPKYEVRIMLGEAIKTHKKWRSPMSKQDQLTWIVTATIWGECRSGGETCMRAVAHVILNRAKADRKEFGSGVQGAIWKPYQFSVWNKGDPNRATLLKIARGELPEGHPDFEAWKVGKKVAREALAGRSKDNTGGALFYHATSIKAPYWAPKMQQTKKIGGHIFYKDDRA